MPGVPNSALLDLISNTLKNLPDLEFEIALQYQVWEICNQWFKNKKRQEDSGTSIERKVMLDSSGNARHVRLYQRTPINVPNVMDTISAPWCQCETFWSVERREILRNKQPSKIVDMLEKARKDGLISMAELLEGRGILPPASATDDLNPMGLLYWLSMLEDGTTSAGGFDAYRVRFTGGTSSTTKGGINGALAAKAKWRNYAASYVSVNAELIKRLRRAVTATSFQAPMLAKDVVEGPRSDYRIYMDLDTHVEYEDYATSANENVGPDLDKFHGLTSFRRIPVVYMSALDGLTIIGGSGTSNSPAPIIGANFSKFYPITLSGDWMVEDGPIKDIESHNVMTTFVDGSYQYFCSNVREGGFVVHKEITA